MRKMITSAIIAPILLGGAVYFFFPGWAIERVRRFLRRHAGLSKHNIKVGDHRWVYLDGGKGEAILFVHGFGMEKDGWDLFAGNWRGSYRLIIPDLPGFGETNGIDSSVYDVPHQAERLERFVNALNVQSFHLAGISMGGAIAAYYAAEHPGKVKSLLLMAPAGVLSSVPSEAWRDYLAKGKNIFLYKNREQFDGLLDAIFYRKPFVPGSFKRYFAERGAGGYRLREKILEDLEKGLDILEDRLFKVKAPTLIIWGENDRVLHVSGAEKFQRLIPNCRLITLTECGHVVFYDQPAAARQAYNDFLQTME